MIKIQTGQIFWIGKEEIYDKKKGKRKLRFAITQPNVMIENRLETLEYDLLEDNISLIKQLRLNVGDYIELTYQDCGRCFYHTGENGENVPKFYTNKEVININVIK